MECPNCHHKIGKFDWSQNCRYCGVNLMYYNLENTLKEDAQRTELSYAKLRIFSSKAKAASVGGKLQIVRLVMLLGCIGLLMVPIGKLDVSTVLFSRSLTFNALECYNMLSGGSLGHLSSLASSAVIGPVAGAAVALYYGILALAVACVLQILFFVFSLWKPRFWSGFVAFSSVLGIGAGIASIVLSGKLSRMAEAAGSFASFSNGYGCYAAIAGFVIMFAINLVFVIKGIRITYKEGDEYRVEVLHKLEKGEVKLADLPLPIYETEEERKERLAELAGEDTGKSDAEESEETEKKEETVNG